MHWRRTAGLVLVALGVAVAAAAAEAASLADAAEHRDWTSVRALVHKGAAGVNTPQVDGTRGWHERDFASV